MATQLARAGLHPRKRIVLIDERLAGSDHGTGIQTAIDPMDRGPDPPSPGIQLPEPRRRTAIVGHAPEVQVQGAELRDFEKGRAENGGADRQPEIGLPLPDPLERGSGMQIQRLERLGWEPWTPVTPKMRTRSRAANQRPREGRDPIRDKDEAVLGNVPSETPQHIARATRHDLTTHDHPGQPWRLHDDRPPGTLLQLRVCGEHGKAHERRSGGMGIPDTASRVPK